jgi:hypothetical protein
VAHRGRENADERLAFELASGRTVQDAAAAARVAQRTAFRRLADPMFKARVAELRGIMVDRAVGEMADGMASAVKVLRRLMRQGEEMVQLRAATKFLEIAHRFLGESVLGDNGTPNTLGDQLRTLIQGDIEERGRRALVSKDGFAAETRVGMPSRPN